ncbi:WD-repeat protein, partial [Reticulomyxa filosa]
DKSIRLWDIRSCQQMQVFNGHKNSVWCVEYSPFVIKNNIGNANVICSGSLDSTIRFWDIRSNKNELYMIKGNEGYDGILCLKFIELKKRANTNNDTYDLNLCYKIKVKINCKIFQVLFFCTESNTIVFMVIHDINFFYFKKCGI